MPSKVEFLSYKTIKTQGSGVQKVMASTTPSYHIHLGSSFLYERVLNVVPYYSIFVAFLYILMFNSYRPP